MDRRLERRNDRANQQQPVDPIERLRRQGEAMSTTGASLKRLADAQEPLYKSLDEARSTGSRCCPACWRPGRCVLPK